MNELKSINVLEKAGFTHDQAKAVVEVVEEGIQRGFERFVEVLDRRLGEFELRIKVEFQTLRTEIQTTRAELLKDQRDQMLRFAGLVSLIVAVIGAAIGVAIKYL